jgi:uncharacterized protein YjiS (DUF1127 family)
MEDFVMRDYVLHRAQSLGLGDASFSLRNLWRNLLARRSVNRLENLDDHMLRDIGVTREELQWAVGLPLTVNAAFALEERAFKRTQGRRAQS